MTLSKKQKVAFLSVSSNTTLIILKTVAGVMSGSVSIISEAIHSSMDLLAAIIAYISVSISGKPADEGHPYGHGKVENISGVIEGALIFVAAFLIIKEAIEKILNPAPMEASYLGIGVMAFSALINTLVAYQLYKTAKEEDSVALEADALHLKTDVYTSLGVACGLILIKITGFMILDPIVAILVACLIIKESWHLCSVAFSPLLDTRLGEQEEAPILQVISVYQEERCLEIRHFKTRKSGSRKFVDFHMAFPEDLTISQGNQLADELREEIYKVCPEAHIHINLEVRGNRISQPI